MDGTLSQERLHRLRPSDIDAIRESIKTKAGLKNVITTFVVYLMNLKHPLAVELDDVSRITLQLKMADLWSIVQPKDFIGVFHVLNDEVISTLCEALGIDHGGISKLFWSNRKDSVLLTVREELSKLQAYGEIANVSKVTDVKSPYLVVRDLSEPLQEGEIFPPAVGAGKRRTKGSKKQHPSKSANEE